MNTTMNKAIAGGLSVPFMTVLIKTILWTFPSTTTLFTPEYTDALTMLVSGVMTGLVVYYTPNAKKEGE